MDENHINEFVSDILNAMHYKGITIEVGDVPEFTNIVKGMLSVYGFTE